MSKKFFKTSFENSYHTKSIIQMWPKEIPPKKNHFSKFGDFSHKNWEYSLLFHFSTFWNLEYNCCNDISNLKWQLLCLHWWVNLVGLTCTLNPSSREVLNPKPFWSSKEIMFIMCSTGRVVHRSRARIIHSY